MQMICARALFLGCLTPYVIGHSWVEQLTVIRNGLFVGSNGYPRAYVPRSTSNFRDGMMQWLLPDANSGRTQINGSDLICSPTQNLQTQNSPFDRLQANSRDYVALKYQENGHVTADAQNPGYRYRGGSVFVFGTFSPAANEKLVDVMQWRRSGKPQGSSLLTVQKFDDGRCYQRGPNVGSLAFERAQKFPDKSANNSSPSDQWCETDVQLPQISADVTYTLYWVWLYSFADTKQNSTKDEIYTTCMDIDMKLKPIQDSAPMNPLAQQDPQSRAVTDYEQRAHSGSSTCITSGSTVASSLNESVWGSAAATIMDNNTASVDYTAAQIVEVPCSTLEPSPSSAL